MPDDKWTDLQRLADKIVNEVLAVLFDHPGVVLALDAVNERIRKELRGKMTKVVKDNIQKHTTGWSDVRYPTCPACGGSMDKWKPGDSGGFHILGVTDATYKCRGECHKREITMEGALEHLACNAVAKCDRAMANDALKKKK